MTIPWAILAGLGQGASSLGSDIVQRDVLRDQQAKQDALLADQRKRQDALDALNRLVTLQKMGGQEIPAGQDPSVMLQGATQANDLRSGGAIPNSAFGLPDEATPNAYGKPQLVDVGGRKVLLDPSKAPEALQERRQSLADMARDRRATQAQDAIAGRQKVTEDAKTLAGVKAAQSNYNTLKALNPKHALVQSPFDADNAANYDAAIKFEQAQQLQKSAYHPEARAKYGSFVDPKNPTAPPVFIPEDEASRQGFIPAQKSGSGGGQQQNMQARLLGAVSEGRLADDRMGQFEQQHLKNGHLDVSSLDQVLGNTATNLASSHSLKDIAAQGFAEGHMNQGDKSDYLQYMRDARLISRAEQLMSARGGSEAMASDNAFLARGGAHAPEATVRAAQKSRKALFGKLGAVMQTLSPDQAAKLAQGLDALQKDDANFDYAGLGKDVFSSPAQQGAPSGGGGGVASKYGVPLVRQP